VRDPAPHYSHLMSNTQQKVSSISLWVAIGVLLAGAASVTWLYLQPRLPLLELVRAQGTLVVATRETPSVMFEGAEGADGFEHALTQQFADVLGVDVRYVFPATVEELLDKVASGKVHLAAAGLTATPNPVGARALFDSLPVRHRADRLPAWQ
jgi:membrane-bound lytic murein transglycosylase MltF